MRLTPAQLSALLEGSIGGGCRGGETRSADAPADLRQSESGAFESSRRALASHDLIRP